MDKSDSKYTSCPYCGQTIRKHSVLCEHCKKILDSRVARNRDMQINLQGKGWGNKVSRGGSKSKGESQVGPVGGKACKICQKLEKNSDCTGCHSWCRTIIILLSRICPE